MRAPRRPRRALALAPIQPLESRRLLAAPVAVDDLFRVAEDGAISTGTSALVLDSPPGDYIGGGVLRRFDGDDGAYRASGSENGVWLSFDSLGGAPRNWWTLSFVPPVGRKLAAGEVFTGATRFPFQGPGYPGMDISGNGRGSNQLTGAFTVLEYAANPDGSVARFAATFTQSCEGVMPPLTGEVRYNSATIAGGVLANDTDADGDPLTVALVAGPAHGTLALTPSGAFDYRPDANFHGTDTFVYTVSDGMSTSAPATARIEVTPVNDAPTAADFDVTVGAGETLRMGAPGVLAGAADLDGDALCAAAITVQPTYGTVTLRPDGSFEYRANHWYRGQDSFRFSVTDGKAYAGGAVRIRVVEGPGYYTTPELDPRPVRVVEGTTAEVVVGVLRTHPNDPASGYAATADFGDGAGPIAARIVPTADRTLREVRVAHTFTRVGRTPFLLRVTGPDLLQAIVDSRDAVVLPRGSQPLAARLDAASDSGVSASDGLTRVRTPRLVGTGPVGARVVVTGVPLTPGGTPFAAGAALVGADGRWSLQTAPLADGAYRFDAEATPEFEPSLRASTATVVIDTAGPRVVAAALDVAKGRLSLTVKDERTGVAPLPASGAWSVTRRLGRLARAVPVSAVATSGGPAGRVLALTLDRGRRLAAGTYDLGGDGKGITDLAGNTLDGEFRGAWPTGDGRPGGALAARFTVIYGKLGRWSAPAQK